LLPSMVFTLTGLFDKCKMMGTAKAPHPVPEGKESAVCPITGLSADGSSEAANTLHEEAFEELAKDPDIVEERRTMGRVSAGTKVNDLGTTAVQLENVKQIPLNVISGTHKATIDTRELVRSVGLLKLQEFTSTFYRKAFADPYLDKFIRNHHDEHGREHGERFALWIVEKFGDGTPWTESRRSRPVDVMTIAGRRYEVAHDRSSAHFAAWNSPKREPERIGEHFKPDDARTWMRMHFWAAREVGLFEPEYTAFMDYYIRFIGHFISIYSSKAPPFVRESVRWSADPSNIKEYMTSGNMMTDVIGKPLHRELEKLPRHEQVYTGSKHPNPAWPYELRH